MSGQYRWASHAKFIDRSPVDPARRETPADEAARPEDLDCFLDEFQAEITRLRQATPKSPLGVLWRSPIDDPSGYADEGRCFAKALAAGERELALQKLQWSDRRLKLSEPDRVLLKALAAARRPTNRVSITNCIPALAEPDPAALVNVLRTTFETDRLPPDWPARLDRFDKVWVISRHNRETFIRSGAAPERIRVVPSCLDAQLYHPDGPRRELPRGCRGRFVFLSVFDWQYRKGWDVLLKAYAREFSLQDDAVLLLKVSRGHGQSSAWMRDQAARALAEANTTLEHRPDVLFVEELLDPHQMAALYRSVDAFVLASRGEGWGRPYMEAMACGLPVIGTAASGNVDFMREENSLLAPAELVDVSEPAAAEIEVFRGHR